MAEEKVEVKEEKAEETKEETKEETVENEKDEEIPDEEVIDLQTNEEPRKELELEIDERKISHEKLRSYEV